MVQFLRTDKGKIVKYEGKINDLYYEGQPWHSVFGFHFIIKQKRWSKTPTFHGFASSTLCNDPTA